MHARSFLSAAGLSAAQASTTSPSVALERRGEGAATLLLLLLLLRPRMAANTLSQAPSQQAPTTS